MLKAIWAMTKDHLVGKGNTIPWYIKEEFAHFRRQTLHQDVLMGQSTYLSLPKNFTDRNMYVLSKNPNWKPDNSSVVVLSDYTEFIKKYQNNLHQDLYVMGGISIYEQLVPHCDELIISIVKGDYEGDRYLYNVELNDFEIYKIENFKQFDVYYYRKRLK
ncbi:dihydrofolate reductase [Candidatus Mycoplasma pogonae]